MRIPAALLTGALLASVAAPLAVSAEETPEMTARAESLARAAPRSLGRLGLGNRAIENIDSAVFRNVRASYKRNVVVNDRVTFCGEVSFTLPDGEETGWLKFMYTPGDPTEFATSRRDVGNVYGVGPEVRERFCEADDINWLSGDYADLMQPSASEERAEADF